MENETKTTAEAETTSTTEATLDDIRKEIAKLKEENEKLRKANTNASADASKWKKQYQEKLTAEEQAEAKRKEEADALLNELNALKKDKAISDHTSQFLSLGFDEALAKSSAEAMVDSDFPKIFANMKAFIEAHDKNLNAEILKSTPKPGSAGGSNATVTAEQFKKMGLSEMAKLQREQPDLYAQLTNRR